MDSVQIETKTIRGYLLGGLPDDEANAVEELYFTNRLFFNEIRRAELALISGYLDGALTPSEREQFESRYLHIPRLQKLVEEVRQRRSVSTRQAWGRLLRVAGVAAMALIAVIAGIVILWHPWNKQRARREAKPPTIQLFLAPGLTKGQASPPNELILPVKGQPVEIIAELPGEESSADYVAEVFNVDRDGARKSIWTSGPVRSVRSGGGQQVSLIPPSASLLAGDYILNLKMQNGPVRETYIFRVTASRP